MNFPIISIICTVILISLAWWVTDQLIGNEYVLKIVRVVLVVVSVLYVIGLLSGVAPPISFRG